MRSLRLAALSSLLLSSSVFAAKAATVALYPAEVLGAEAAELARVRAAIALDLLRQGCELAPSDEVTAFVEKHPSGGCLNLDDAERTGCLGELAKRTGAHKALLLVVSPRARNELRISAQVVDGEGRELKNVSRAWPPAQKGAVQPAIETAFRELAPALELNAATEISITPLTTQPAEQTGTAAAVPPAHQAAPSPEQPPASAPSSGGWRRVAGWTGVGVGAALLAGGAWGLVDGAGARSDLERYYGGGAPHGAAEESRLTDLRDRMNRGQLIGGIGLGAGAALAAAGTWLLLTAPPPEAAAPGDVSLLVGPGQLALTVRLP